MLHSILIGVVLAAVASALTVKSRWGRFWREELAAWDQLPFSSKSAAHFPTDRPDPKAFQKGKLVT
jgi:hypothetical protein